MAIATDRSCAGNQPIEPMCPSYDKTRGGSAQNRPGLPRLLVGLAAMVPSPPVSPVLRAISCPALVASVGDKSRNPPRGLPCWRGKPSRQIAIGTTASSYVWVSSSPFKSGLCKAFMTKPWRNVWIMMTRPAARRKKKSRLGIWPDIIGRRLRSTYWETYCV